MSLEDLSTKSDLEKQQTKVAFDMKELVDSIPEGEQKDALINPFTGAFIKKNLDPLNYRLYFILLGLNDPGNTINENTGVKYEFDLRSEDSIDPFDAGIIQKFIVENFKK